MFGRRRRHERGPRIPVTVVTGFLGAGKTTLLRHFLSTPEGSNTAILVNEFGAVGIDNAILRSSTDEAILLGNGCLCCDFRSDLQIALRQLVSDRDKGRVTDFERIVIETSGLADPGPILRTFATDRALGDEFHLQCVAVVVDAVQGMQALNQFSEARRQVIVADRIIVTKTDLTEARSNSELMVTLRALNPRIPVALATDGKINPYFLTENGNEWRLAANYFAETVHSDRINSFVLSFDEPVAWDVFARAMETLVALRGADLLRVKGILNVHGCDGPVVVQFVRHLANPPVELDTWPAGGRVSRIVFITQEIPARAVRDLFDAAAALAIE
ncbi:MAG: GTP-binding protein [Rhizobiales bacterium]|nr:GTP-binding protein [Hyphomicrobiales bacterium]